MMKKFFTDKERAPVLLCILCIAIFYFCTILKGQGWGDDFALYLLHAKNVAEGNAYGETGYIFNPLAESYAPQNYPPGFPVLIAPLYSIFGLNLTSYKILLTGFFIWMLWLIYLILKKYLNLKYLLAIVIVVGLSPYLWALRNNITPDFPAACFLLLAIWLELKRDKRNSTALSVAEGLSIYISYAMRTTGFVLIAALFYRYLVEKKRKDKKMFIVFAAFLLPAIVQSFLMPHAEGYLFMLANKFSGQHIQIILSDFFLQINRYIDDFQYFTLLGTINGELNKVFTSLCFCFFLTGWYLHSRKHFSFIDVFLILFTGLIFVWPFFQGIRYLLPVLPFYVYFIFNAIYHIDVLWFRKFVMWLSAGLILLIYSGYYTNAKYGEMQYGVDYYTNKQIFDFIKQNTKQDAVIMSTKPRTFTLYTARKGIVFPDVGYWNQYYECLQKNNVEYVVTGHIDYNNYPTETARQDTLKFVSVFKNESFEMFEVINP